MPAPLPSPSNRPGRPVAAIKDGKIALVDPGEIDYEPVHHSQGWAESTHLAPLLSTMKGARSFIASKYVSSQYLPLVEKEAPLVNTIDEETGDSFGKTIGEKMGHRHARVEGVVHSVSPEAINIQTEDGKLHTHELHRHFPHSRKTFTHDRPLVQPGDVVTAGRPIAASNYVTDDGRLAFGRNLRVAYVPGRDSSTFEDAITVSQSAADKLKSEHLFGYDIDHSRGAESKKAKYVSMFPNKYTNDQLAKIGPDGHALVGAKLNPGDPILLGYEPRVLSAKDSALGNLHKVLRESYRDLSQTWSKPHPAEVVDAIKSRKGMRVNVVSHMPLRAGDKISALSGSKGVVSQVVPDHQMFHDASGQHMEILINPMSIIGRVNPQANFETLLGKAAENRGRPYNLPGSAKESWRDYVEGELKAHGLVDKEDLHDPVTNKKVPRVMTGRQYFLKLEHQSFGKESGRGDGALDLNDQPTKGGEEGAKRMGGLIDASLLSHGAVNVLRDKQLHRTGGNPELWRNIRAGIPLPAPKTPFIFDKFINSLKGAGINVTREGSKFHLKALTDADVDALAPHALQNVETVDRKGNPVPGGLMDHALHGGPEGLQFSKYQLDQPTVNPLFEEPIRRFLGLTQNKYRDIIAGRETINGKTGVSALVDEAKKVNLDDVIKNAKEQIRSGRKSKRDDAVKLLNFATGFQRGELTPEHAVITKIPVLPPAYRPVTNAGNVQLVSDSNYLYRDLHAAQTALRANRADLPEHELADQKLAVYDAIKSVQGLGDPINPEMQAKGVKGFVKTISGTGGPKSGMFMSKVVGHPVNAGGRSVIIPDGNLDMDEVGIPEKSAWKAYGAFAMGEMARDGMPHHQAALEIEKKTTTAKNYLLKAMAKRPLMVSRDPALHRFSIMGAHAKLRSDNNVAISPIVVKPYGADFDGDSGRFLLWCKVQFEKGVWVNHTNKYVMSISQSKPLSFQGPIDIQDFPVIPESKTTLPSGTIVYDVPAGVQIYAVDPVTGAQEFCAVTKFTVHQNLQTKFVSLAGGREDLFVSEDHSLLCYRHGRIKPTKPSNALGLMVPVSKQISLNDWEITESVFVTGESTRGFGKQKHAFQMPLDRDTGLFLGLMLGDGWVDRYADDLHLAVSERGIEEAFHRVTRSSSLPFENGSRDMVVFESDGSLCAEGTRRDVKGRISVFCRWFGRWLKPHIGLGALNKRIPSFCYSAPIEHLLGLLDGLTSTDGTVNYNKAEAKGKHQMQYSIATSSPDLVAGIRIIARRLGIRVYASQYVSETSGNPAWICSFSTVDFKQMFLRHGFSLVHKRKNEIFQSSILNVDENCNTACANDLVPYPSELHQFFLETRSRVMAHSYKAKAASLAVSLSKAKADGFASRSLMRMFVKEFADMDSIPVGLEGYIDLVNDDSLQWMKVTDVQDAGVMDGYDLTVPGPYTFATASGVFVQDSMNFHVPISDEAVQDVHKMLPSNNLLSIKDRQVAYLPSQESIGGLSSLTTPDHSLPTVTFPDIKSARDAYKRGEIAVNQPVRIAPTFPQLSALLSTP